MKCLAKAWFVWLAVVAVAVPAQERRALHGQVVDGSGKPLAGARVRLCWTPVGWPSRGEADQVEVRSDDRGRFVAQLLPQLAYSGHAVAERAEGSLASAAVAGLAAGQSVTLHADRAVAPGRISLRSAMEWPVPQPLQLEVAAAAASPWFVPVVDGEVPPLPQPWLALVRDAAGEPLWLGPTREEGKSHVVVLPLHCEVEFLVHGAGGRPLAGAQAHVLMGSSAESLQGAGWFEAVPPRIWRPLGKSDQHGVLRTVMVNDPSGASAMVIAAPGYAEMQVLRDAAGKILVGGQPGKPPTSLTQPAALGLAPAARLQVLERDMPLAGAAVVISSTSSQRHRDRTAELRTDALGQVELPLGEPPVESLLHVQVAGGPWQYRRIAWAAGKTTTVDLASQRRLELQCVRPDGGPASGFVGVLVAAGSHLAARHQVVVATDQGGRLLRTVGPDAWALLLTDGDSYASFEVPRYDADPPLPARVVLAARPFQRLAVTVEEAVGRPLAGATWQWQGLMFRPVPQGTPRFHLARIEEYLMQQLAMERASDARGRLDLRLTSIENAVGYVVNHEASRRRASGAITVGETGPLLIELR